MAARINAQFFRDAVQAWYPEYETKAYFVPPVIITRIPFDKEHVAGQNVLVPQCLTVQASVAQCAAAASGATAQHSTRHPAPLTVNQVRPLISATHITQQGKKAIEGIASRMWNEACSHIRVQESDQRDDLAQQQVLFCLRELAREQNEVMFVLSQLDFFDYLGKPCYSADVKRLGFPTIGSSGQRKNLQGDFDILMIHRFYGIVVGEVKAVQSNQQHLNRSQQDTDGDIIIRIQKAIKQLDKSESVLRHLTSVLAPKVKIRKTLILPSVSSADLKRVLSTCTVLQQNLVRCLGAHDVTQTIELCLLSDNLSNSQDQWQIGQIQTWWNKRVSGENDPVMTMDLYLDLIARFCGPATMVSIYCVSEPRIEVRTEGEGVSAVGERMAQLVLTPEQVTLLHRAPRRVFIHGPPGTGKSVTLALMAVRWVNDGKDVYLVSLHWTSRAMTHLLKKQIETTSNKNAGTRGNITLLEYSFSETGAPDVTRAIDEVRREAAGGKEILFILDELSMRIIIIEIVALFTYFSTLLQIPNVSLWMVSCFHKCPIPGVESVFMTIPLRSPPFVLKELQEMYAWYDDTYLKDYSHSCMVAPSNGPDVIRLRHEGKDHTSEWPLDCTKCGENIADVLLQLGVGSKGQSSGSSKKHGTCANKSNQSKLKTTSVPPLQYRDVFLLCSALMYYDFVMDESGNVTLSDVGVIRGLRSKGIPVSLYRNVGPENTAIARVDVVTVGNYLHFSGLERKVVVHLQHGDAPEGADENSHSEIQKNTYDRYHAMSRCTSQLVIVEVPKSCLRELEFDLD